MKQSHEDTLRDVLIHLAQVEEYSRRSLEDDVVIDACSLRLPAAVNLLGRLPEDTLDALFGGQWHAMRGMRNRIAHGYLAIRADVVRATVRDDLPRMREAIEGHLARLA